MFPTRFFPTRYFPSRYYPRNSGNIVLPNISLDLGSIGIIRTSDLKIISILRTHAFDENSIVKKIDLGVLKI